MSNDFYPAFLLKRNRIVRKDRRRPRRRRKISLRDFREKTRTGTKRRGKVE